MPAPTLLERPPENNRTTTQTPTPGLDAEVLTPNLLRLKLLLHLNLGNFIYLFYFNFF
jgi:hypothetical protein